VPVSTTTSITSQEQAALQPWWRRLLLLLQQQQVCQHSWHACRAPPGEQLHQWWCLKDASSTFMACVISCCRQGR
jgi:hypothetical protein